MSTSFQQIREHLAEAEADATMPDEWAWCYKVDVAALLDVAQAAQWVHGDGVCENFDTSRGDLNCYREPPEGWAIPKKDPCLRCALDRLADLLPQQCSEDGL